MFTANYSVLIILKIIKLEILRSFEKTTLRHENGDMKWLGPVCFLL